MRCAAMVNRSRAASIASRQLKSRPAGECWESCGRQSRPPRRYRRNLCHEISMKTLCGTGFALIVLALDLASPVKGQTAAASASASTAVRERAWKIAGLTAPADIVIDHWGIAHIFAASTRDAFFLQGYNAARERLWQIDLWRKRGLGLLSKSFGPAYVDQDRAARLFLYRGDMDQEWGAYAPDSKQWVTAFVEGVNAYVAEVGSKDRPLPIEFKLTDSLPDTWLPQDVLRIRSHALVSNITSEVARARVVCAGGLKADQLRRKIEPAGHKMAIPEGLNPCDVPAD